jgi:hypothetical protein
MHTPSQIIGHVDTISEYQRIFINEEIGKNTHAGMFKSKRDKTLNLKLDNLEEMWSVLEENFNLYSISEYKSIIIEKDFVASLNWCCESSFICISVIVSANSIYECNKYISNIEKKLKQFKADNKTVQYSILQYDNGALNEIGYYDIIDMEFNPLAVPFINNIDEYIENFLDSKAPLLILQGEPGTGKTTLIKYILKKIQKRVLRLRDELKVTYSFDENIFYSSDFYKQLIFDDYDVQVFEDINQILYKNQEAETNPINKFLSVTDGLVSKYKKIIISTNIESKHQLHPALLRPGRCFDVVEFRKLQGVEIDNLCDSCAKDLYLQTESINLSEFFAQKNGSCNTKLLSSRIGF